MQNTGLPTQNETSEIKFHPTIRLRSSLHIEVSSFAVNPVSVWWIIMISMNMYEYVYNVLCTGNRKVKKR